MTSEQYEAMRVKSLNETPGDLSGVDCPLCLNRGYRFELRDGHPVSISCSCMAKRRALIRIRRSGLENMLERYTFASYQTPEPWQKAAERRAREYLSAPDGAWLVITGAVGSGKTHLCTAVCGELLDAGKDVRYMLWRDEARRLKAAINDDGFDDMLRPLLDVEVLYIDDFFKARDGNVSDADVNLAFMLLNGRYNDARKRTILSSELTVEQIMNIDQALGSRIYERGKDYYLRISGDGKNWRLRRNAAGCQAPERRIDG